MTTSQRAHVSRSSYRTLCITLTLLIPATLLAFGKSYFNGLTFSGLTVSPLIHVHAAS